MDEAITGVTVSNTGGLGFLDGLLERGGQVLDLVLAREFPEQFTNAGAGEVVRDTEVDAETGSQFFTQDNLVRVGLVLAAVAAVVLVLRKN